MEFTPQSADECAGIVLLQNSKCHFRFVVTQVKGKGSVVRLIKCEKGVETILAEQPIETGRIYFHIVLNYVLD
jgi:alpha-N-arabinofuranosidase